MLTRKEKLRLVLGITLFLIAISVIMSSLLSCCGATLASREPSKKLTKESLRRDPVPPEALETERLLQMLEIPARDLRDITLRLADPGVPIPKVVNSQPPDYKVGDTRQFWVSNVTTHQNFQITAKVIYKTDHAYVWVEEGAYVNQEDIEAAADRFEYKFYPTDREFFGSEWSPGVDNDVHVSLLISNKLGPRAAGYYNSMDEYSRLIHKDSNEMEMFYLSSDSEINDSYFDCVLAHEFAHMIQWYHHANQANWINEGLAELACQINDLDPGSKRYYFGANPDIQLNGWPELGEATAHYGSAYMFMSYFLDRFGKTATQALVNSQVYSTAAVDDVLQNNNFDSAFDKVFAEWTVANYIDNPQVGNGEYAYYTTSPPPFYPIAKFVAGDYPAEIIDGVSQHGTHYIELRGDGELEADFTGNTLVGLSPTKAFKGKYLWWGGSNNDSDTTLTRTFDLSDVTEATLIFWTWYEIESDFDYAYVEVSIDGERWITLPGLATTTENPQGANYGSGYTGKSGTTGKTGRARWIQEKVDLSQYAGKEVMIRFEYITDAGLTEPGFFLDDIEIPEIGYCHDAESDDGGWEAKGFLRNANVLPQHWSVQLISVGAEKTTVEKMLISDDATGRAVVNLNDAQFAVLVVSGMTPVTLEKTRYHLALRPKN